MEGSSTSRSSAMDCLGSILRFFIRSTGTSMALSNRLDQVRVAEHPQPLHLICERCRFLTYTPRALVRPCSSSRELSSVRPAFAAPSPKFLLSFPQSLPLSGPFQSLPPMSASQIHEPATPAFTTVAGNDQVGMSLSSTNRKMILNRPTV